MTHQPMSRGLTALIPTAAAPATSSAGERAAAQLHHLRTVALPAPVVAAAVELLADRIRDPDPTTRQAAAAVLAHLTAALQTLDG